MSLPGRCVALSRAGHTKGTPCPAAWHGGTEGSPVPLLAPLWAQITQSPRPGRLGGDPPQLRGIWGGEQCQDGHRGHCAATDPTQTPAKPFLQGGSDTGAECHREGALKHTHTDCSPALWGHRLLSKAYSLHIFFSSVAGKLFFTHSVCVHWSQVEMRKVQQILHRGS